MIIQSLLILERLVKTIYNLAMNNFNLNFFHSNQRPRSRQEELKERARKLLEEARKEVSVKKLNEQQQRQLTEVSQIIILFLIMSFILFYFFNF